MGRLVFFLSTSFMLFFLIFNFSASINIVFAANSCSGSVQCGNLVSSQGYCSGDSSISCTTNTPCTLVGAGVCVGAGGTVCQAGAPGGICFCSGADCNSYGPNFICLPGCGSCVVNGECRKNVSYGPYCGDGICNNGENHSSCPGDCAQSSTPAPTNAPIACSWCTTQSQCATSGGSWYDSHGYCSSGADGCCDAGGSGGGTGGGGPTPTPQPQFNCGDVCDNDQQCNNRNNQAVCYKGHCVNQNCPSNTQAGKNCACTGSLSCGQQPLFGQGCDATSQQGFINVPDAQANNCNNYANNSGSGAKGYQYCIPKSPASGYTLIAPNCTDLGVKRLGKINPDGSTSSTGLTSADVAAACVQSAPGSTPPPPTGTPFVLQCAGSDATFTPLNFVGDKYTSPIYHPSQATATGIDLIADDNFKTYQIQFIVNGSVKTNVNTPCDYLGGGWYDLCSASTLFNYEGSNITSFQFKLQSGGGDTAYIHSLLWEYCLGGKPWWQVTGGDAITNGGLQSYSTATTNSSSFMLDGSTGNPGNILFGTDTNLVAGAISSTRWIANSLYQEKTYNYAYFNELIPGNAVVNTLGSSIGNTELNGGTVSPDGYYYYKVTGDTTVSSDVVISGSHKSILFVEGGNLLINKKINIQTHGSGFFMAIVGAASDGTKGSIVISPTVTNGASAAIEGIYIADNLFDTGTGANRLYIRGTVVSWQNITFGRDLGGSNSTTPAESIEYDPALIMLYPRSLVKDSTSWQEVIP